MNIFDMTSREKLLLLFRESHQLQKTIAGRPTNDRLEFAISVFTAQNHKAYTIWSICNPVPRSELLENSSVLHDYQSGYVLLRSMYETILVSRFILLDEQFVDSRIVVVMVTQLHGLREQNWLLSEMKNTKPKVKEIKAHLKQLKIEILQHQQYNSLPQFAKDYVNRDDIPNGPWLPKKLETIRPNSENKETSTMKELAHRAGFHESQHFQYNKYFSNYVHSDPFVIMQLAAVMHFGDTELMTEKLYFHTEKFLAVSLHNHIAVCNSESINLSISDEVREIIEFWQDINSGPWTEESAKM